jgi:hypothetical protein
VSEGVGVGVAVTVGIAVAVARAISSGAEFSESGVKAGRVSIARVEVIVAVGRVVFIASGLEATNPFSLLSTLQPINNRHTPANKNE